MRENNKRIGVGDRVQYVIYEGDGAPGDRALDVESFREHGVFALDIEWYLTQQIHPPISRMCNLLPGTDAVLLAKCLGIKNIQAVSHGGGGGDDEDDEAAVDALFSVFDQASQASDAKRFEKCERLRIVCPSCKKAQDFDALQNLDPDRFVVCRLCARAIGFNHVKKTLRQFIRRFVSRLYMHWYVCVNEMCRKQQERGVYAHAHGNVQCGACKEEMKESFTHRDLYLQFSFLSAVFSRASISRAIEAAKEEKNKAAARLALQIYADKLSLLHDVVAQVVQKDGYGVVSLMDLFGCFVSK
eukprot:TRINITY_DN4245_c0_g1_i1.p2 TRINITY_DN4245_c0_g1~~TRINITY_DN4245_c0_g1_i1.p2  ORF type:complete len:300 (-),score=76.70 TRINITY_DN4245_c0_g1_i1:78-977(-)